MEKSGKGEVLCILFIKKSKAFSATTHIFPPLSICPERCIWSPLAVGEVVKVSLTMEAGKKEGFGEYMLGKPVNGVYHRCH